MKVTNKWWLGKLAEIRGFEGEGDPGDGGAGGTTEGEPGEGEGDPEGEPAGKGEGDDSAALKQALDRERRDKRKAEAELKALKKGKQAAEDAELTEVARLTKVNEANQAKALKLAEGFKKSAVKTAVLAAAAKEGFADPSDALRDEVLDGLGVEQDEDDPTQVEIDAADLTTRVKALLKSKPHYKKAVEGAGNNQQRQKSGSKFGGSTNPTGDAATARKTELQMKYPALRGR